MKISTTDNITPITVPPRTERAAVPRASDKVSVGHSASVEAARTDAQTQHAARLEQISAQVKSGTYKVDAGAIAKALVDDAGFSAQVQSAVKGD
jgi:anti-sigma28 factor (negative regulator of flagellin synthesis)